MAETLPILEQIAAALAATVATVTAANGYAVTIAEVKRPHRTGVDWVPKDLGVVLLQGASARVDELATLGSPGGIAWRQTFELTIVVRVGEASATAIDKQLNIVAANVVKAVMADPQRGGLAIDTVQLDPEYPAAGDGIEGLVLRFDVTYRVADNDPYTQV